MLWDNESKSKVAEVDFFDPISDLKVVGGWVILTVKNVVIVFDFEAESGLDSEICKFEARVDLKSQVSAACGSDGSLTVIVPFADKEVKKIQCYKDGKVEDTNHTLDDKYVFCAIADGAQYAAFANIHGNYFTIYRLESFEKK